MTHPHPQRPYVGAHLLLMKNDTILLHRRLVKSALFHHYALPGGKVDVGESATEAMIREAQEEIGVTLRVEDLQMFLTLHRPHAVYGADQEREDIIEFYFVATNWEGTPVNLEPDRADNLDFYPVDKLPMPYTSRLQFVLNCLKNGITYAEVPKE